ncbi:MAG: hypothetical protein ROZ00_15365 [Denitratisoma sp.]|nr:hypothetical protein [Denitratisoma sp.]
MRSALILLFVIGLLGCAPNAAVYYLPSVEGGRVIAGRCVPLPSRVEFTVDNVRISAHVSAVRGRQFVSLSLYPFPTQTVRFLSERFELRDSVQGRPIPVVSLEVFRHDREKALTEPYPRGNAAPTASPYFNVLIYMDDTSAEVFELRSPPIAVDGVERFIPAIRFKRETWVGVSPLNC